MFYFHSASLALQPKSGCKVKTNFRIVQIFIAVLTAFNIRNLAGSLSRLPRRCAASFSKASAKLYTFSFPSKFFLTFLCFKTCFSNSKVDLFIRFQPVKLYKNFSSILKEINWANDQTLSVNIFFNLKKHNVGFISYL